MPPPPEPDLQPESPPEPGGDPWATRLRTLAPFAALVRQPGFAFGAWQRSERRPDGAWTMPWYELAADGLRLVTAARSWVISGFDWSTWAKTGEARRLIDDPSAMRDATPEQIARLLTLAIRSDRFSEGELAAAWESGFIGRLLDRVAVLDAQAAGREDPGWEGPAPTSPSG